MKKLILIRHCKSDWSGGASSDHDRPLNARGRKNAMLLGQWLQTTGHLPDEVFCSSAERTVETARRLNLPEATAIITSRDLYLAEPEKILHILRTASADTIALIGHNPGCASVASSFAVDPPEHPDFPRYPTGSTLVLAFNISDWAELETGSGSVVDFTVPRDLA